eukprot:GHVT01041814.1.p1 GENE.GHVT01041814.1~~GHVT01041814.1.p1  ORF type:complete len:170 (-),score=3.93 GHVT01041814.1:311-820(-)
MFSKFQFFSHMILCVSVIVENFTLALYSFAGSSINLTAIVAAAAACVVGPSVEEADPSESESHKDGRTYSGSVTALPSTDVGKQENAVSSKLVPGVSDSSIISKASKADSVPQDQGTAFPGVSDLYRSVVKIHCTSTPPNYGQPWQMRKQRDVTGSERILGKKPTETSR